MQRPITRGASAGAGLIFHVFAQDSTSTSGAGKASIGFGSWSCYYIRNGEAISGAITPQDITTIGTYAAPTANTNIRIKAVDNTNMIGIYEVQIHADWVNTTNSCQSLTIYLTASGVAVLPIQIPLIGINQQATTQEANVTQWLSSAAATPTVAGVPEVDVTHWIGTAAATPTVAGVPEVDVTHLGGGAQSATDLKDFADDGYDPATNKVQGVVLTDTLTTYTGNTPQTGDAYARLGAPQGASVSADILVLDNLVDDLESRIGTPSNLGSGATVAANLVDIEGQTDDIGAAGAGLTALPWNAAWDAEVESEVNDALVTHRLDELLNADSDIDGAAPPAVGSVFHELMTKTTGSFTYDQTTDSLEAIKDSGGGGLDAAGVRAAVGLASANLDTQLSAIDGVTDKLDTAVELDGAVYRFTTNALEQAPAGAAGSIVLGPEYA